MSLREFPFELSCLYRCQCPHRIAGFGGFLPIALQHTCTVQRITPRRHRTAKTDPDCVKTPMDAMGSPNRSQKSAPALSRLGFLGVKLKTRRLYASSGNGAESFYTDSTLLGHS